MNEKQQQLTFDKGITNVPSDAICSDNALEESLGMIYDDGEHRVIQRPKEVMLESDKILFRHDDRYILLEVVEHEDPDETTYTYYLSWRSTNGTHEDICQLPSANVNITSIGKTLIVKTSEDIKYFLWKPDENDYSDISRIPEPKVEIAVSNMYTARLKRCATGEAITWGENNTPSENTAEQEQYNNLVIGMYSELRKKIAKDNHFCNPFFVRYALELFDGSHIYASAPIAMFPSINENTYAIFHAENDGSVEMLVYEHRLIFKAVYDYSDWKDVVKGVILYATDEVNIYDTGRDQHMRRRAYYPKQWNGVIVLCTWGTNFNTHERTESFAAQSGYMDVDITDSNRYVYPLEKFSKKEIEDQLKSLSIYYKIAELGAVQNVTSWKDMAEYIKPYTIENLTTQEQMEDDYFSHCPLSSSSMMAYNQRLLLGNVNRGFYSGAEEFICYDNNSQSTYVVFVYIKTPTGQRVIMKTFTSYQKMGIWFYYPDPRAFKAVIFTQSGATYTWRCTLDLQEHPYLNGAYYFNGLPNGAESTPTPSIGTSVTYESCEADVNESMENLPNQVWVSEVSNPFVFRAEGNITVGDGDIIGISSITQALSEGQFGQYPLVVFTTEGIWAASTSTTGLFSAVHPMSREVAIKDNPCITQTDGAIFFASNKGLMVVVGSQVKCVSEQLSGKDANPFVNFLRNAVIAYDYRDSLLWMFAHGYDNGWIYSIKSGTFGRYAMSGDVDPINVVNNYPDYLIQCNGVVYSLLGRDNINEDNFRYTGTIITRPMKLENALALKSIMQIRHIRQMDGNMAIHLYASNNLGNWVELHSLRGTPWLYYKIKIDFTSMLATDRFAGVILVTQERRINKLR